VKADLYRFGLSPGAGDLVQLGHQRVVRILVYQGNFNVVAALVLLVQLLRRVHSTVSSAEDDDPYPVAHGTSIMFSICKAIMTGVVIIIQWSLH
jgi:hypothetical protein